MKSSKPTGKASKAQHIQSAAFMNAARELECDIDEAKFNAALGKVARHKLRVCPECQHVFQGSGWDGIDAHWKAKHESVMPYDQAWPLIKSGNYK